MNNFQLIIISVSFLVLGSLVSSQEAFSTTFPGENGKIVFRSTQDGNPELYIMDSDGSNQTRLTYSSDFDDRPRISSDGQKIVWEISLHKINTMNIDGTGQEEIVDSEDFVVRPTWSTDGTKISFRNNDEIVTMNPDGSNISEITNGYVGQGRHSWSPDGSKIVFDGSMGGSGTQIYVMNSDGSNIQALTNVPAFNGRPSWSPDGLKIIFDSSRFGKHDIFVMNSDGSNQTRLTFDPEHDTSAKFSPDGTKIVFISQRDGGSNVFLMDSDGSNVQNLRNLPSSIDGHPDWQPLNSNSFTGKNSKSGESDQHLTRPTFGVNHETFEMLVDNGFRFNTQKFQITDNHHTDFTEKQITIGEENTFSATVYADKGLKVQEFLFGIPEAGQAHLAELGIEIWYDKNGKIKQVKTVQQSNVVDVDSVTATHEKSKCQSKEIGKNCDTTNVSMVFLEPLKDKVLAIKAIDNKNRYQITYLNEGVDVIGESLNPMNTKMIPSTIKNEGLLQITQVEKYSPFWVTEDGRTFEMNSFGSFKQVDPEFERFDDSGTAYTRMHSDFDKIVLYEQKRAQDVFDYTNLISELSDSFEHHFENTERMNEEIKKEMSIQEDIANDILDRMDKQTRYY